jgi:hypothetical protein
LTTLLSNVSAIARKFRRIRSSENSIRLNRSVSNLACNNIIGLRIRTFIFTNRTYQSHNESVFWSVVFVFILNHHTLTSIVISFALSSSSKLHLKPFRVGFGFHNFHKRHLEFNREFVNGAIRKHEMVFTTRNRHVESQSRRCQVSVRLELFTVSF